ncbi:isochorismate synthase [Patulibacter minatonensis]|uniref:isochorismate synthase n=1 Tax=Patulibacter minatonensis TaxID=298163 RepID=UPI0005621848|nr:isochorismate synthase [Patulibacter minatonensis]
MSTTIAVQTAEQLLAEHLPGRSYFGSRRGALLAEGERAVLGPGRPEDLVADAERLLADAADGDPAAILLGALPFSPGGTARVFVPEHVRHGAALPIPDAIAAAVAPRPTPAVDEPSRGWHVRPLPSPATYAAAVDEAVRRLAGPGPLEKVVLARALELTAPGPIDVRALLRRLALRDPHAYAFALDLGAGATLVGASPELLVSRHGDVVVARPLAGSTPRRPDPGDDHAAAAALFRSAKDRAEHALVVDDVAATLRPLCADLDVPREPSLVRTNAMWHLATTVVGRLGDPGITSLALAEAMHPTPAVCGTPEPEAAALIAEVEPFDRGPYAGTVGWQDASGDGEWVVTIRCGVAQDDRLRVFAGAGVVAASRGTDELAETQAKFRTFLSALGVEEGR